MTGDVVNSTTASRRSWIPRRRSRSASSQHYRPSALDRSWASSRILEVIGPLHGLDSTALESVLTTIDTSTPTPRIGIEPLPARSLWPYRHGPRAWRVNAISSTDNDLGQALTELGHRSTERLPTEVFVLDDEYLAVEYPHSVGDGHYGLNLVVALLHSRGALGPDLPSRAVWPALREYFRSRPQRITQLHRLRKSQLHNPGPEPRSVHRTDNWQASRRVALGHLDRHRFTQLRDWVATHAPGTTRVGVMSALWCAALRANDIAVDDRATVLINCRRYLRTHQQGQLGNFAVGVPLRIGSLGPLEITTLVRQVTDSGWPLAIIAMGELRARLRRNTAGSDTAGAPDSGRLRLSVSDMGSLPLDHLPWVPGRPRQATAFLDLDGPDALTMLLSDVGEERTVSVSYCTATAPQEKIEAALDVMCSDPISLLT